MKRSSVNFIIDFLSFLLLPAMIATGIIMKYILPPGSGGLGRQQTGGQGREPIEYLLGMTRHEWGTIHFYLAIAFVALMIIHIILHWTWIKNYFKSLFKKRPEA